MRGCRRWSALALAAAVLLGAAPVAAAASRRTPTVSPSNTVVVGPTSGITALTQLSIARDGTGGLAYVQSIGGVAHVFVSRLLNGRFGTPQEVDAGLAGASSQPVIAAGNGGVLLVGFINGGGLYVAQASTPQSAIGAPQLLFAGASNPAISMSNFGKAYLAFTDIAAATSQVDYAYYDTTSWSLGSSLNDNPAQSAGIGGGRPAVVTSGDGLGIAAWGEGGHVYARRLDGATPSTLTQLVDPPSSGGFGEVSASDPSISTGGNSSYAAIAFTEQLSNGVTQQSRVLVNSLVAGQSQGVYGADGLTTPGPEGADQPQASVTEYGAGWATSERTSTHQLWAAQLGPNSQYESQERIDSSTNTAAPDAVPATAGLFSTLIAWQQTPGVAGPAEVRVRYAPNGYDLGPEEVLSSPTAGATDADLGLVDGGDVGGDAAVAWVQGPPYAQQIVAAQLYETPGGFVPEHSFRYATSAHPILSWTPSTESWGPIRYAVSIDGAPATTTYDTSIRTPAPLRDGRHTWEVIAINQAGLSTADAVATVFVDTVKPRAKVHISGPGVIGGDEQVSVRAYDRPPRGLPRRDASGVASIEIRWGAGRPTMHVRRLAGHVYRRPGRYTIRVIITDRAGNRRTITRTIRIYRTAPPAGRRGQR